LIYKYFTYNPFKLKDFAGISAYPHDSNRQGGEGGRVLTGNIRKTISSFTISHFISNFNETHDAANKSKLVGSSREKFERESHF
jgi:hypothetical protein